jgi:excinuclease UvrABC nuclease subunit
LKKVNLEKEKNMKTIKLTFDGYWKSPLGLPKQSGVYCVYRGTYDKTTDKVSLKELLYIGEAENVYDRFNSNGEHETYEDMEKRLRQDEELRFSFAPIQANDRERAEAALIYQHKPTLNIKHVSDFSYSETEMYLTGTTARLKEYFVVE